MTDTENGRPPWNDELPQQFLGKHITIGITRLSADEDLLEHQQMHGDIVAADAEKGIERAPLGATRSSGRGRAVARAWASGSR